MAGQDPVERAADEDVDLQEVASWEPRSLVDRIAVVLHSVVVTGSKLFLVILGLVILLALFVLTGLSLVVDPFVGALVVLSVLPAGALAVYIWYADVTTGEPLSLLAVTFLLAVLFAGFAGALNAVGMVVLSPVALLGSELLVLGLFFFLVVGPVEEAVKLLAVRLYVYNADRFDAVIDGAVYGAVAGLGFATIENAIYITGTLESIGGLGAENVTEAAGSITAARTLAGPGHVLYSAIAGYYLGLAKFNPERAGPLVAKGLLVAAFFHALYNLTVGTAGELLAQLTPLGLFGGLLVYVVGFQSVVGFYLYRKLARYRRVYRETDADRFPVDLTPQRTEFDPDGRSTGSTSPVETAERQGGAEDGATAGDENATGRSSDEWTAWPDDEDPGEDSGQRDGQEASTDGQDDSEADEFSWGIDDEE